MGDYQTLLVFAVSSISSGIGLGAMIRTDIKWLRLTMEKMEKRISRLEDRL
ncbi:hypothetical protein N779_09395 [Vibrio coralliilyticus OCN008]|nr:hypothetical protein N779_09395 [Vibrio coralliilyticus OCN008]